MSRTRATIGTVCRAGIALLVLLGVGLLSAKPAQAQDCSDYGGVLDGFAGDIAPSQLQIDQTCTIRNFPASNPLRTNFSFFTQPGQNDERWLVIFDNVVHTGQMSCNSVLEHKIWFTNGSSTAIQEGCQNLLIPVEKIDKANPAGTTTATVGVPFTYTLTMPVLYDAATGTVINNFGSLNELHSVTLTDDLNATGADLSYVSHTAYWLGSGQPVAHTFSNVGGVLTFDNFPVIPANEQIVIELTVVLDNTPANANGVQFSNTAKWEFGRLIDGVFYEPLPGEWGISPPLTIASPEVTLTKSGPSFLNLGDIGVFTLDLANAGASDAWDVTIVDQFPDLNGPVSGGMCDAAPTMLTAQVFESDGVTPVPGKGPLTFGPGQDIDVNWNGSPFCELTLTVQSPAGVIGPGERLIVTYSSELDINTDNGAALTNIAGATEWFNGSAVNANRQDFSRSLTDGTPATLDHQDAHTVTAALFGSYFNKSVTNLTSGIAPATTAAPGDRLLYELRVRTTDTALNNLRIFDDLGALNPTPVFEPGSLNILTASLPPGADITNSSATGGANGSGYLDIRNLNLPADSELVIEFEIDLAAVIPNGTLATNQSQLTASGGVTGLSDDITINGQAAPDVVGDEDPTVVQIVSSPAFQVEKVSTYPDGDPTLLQAGERLRYTITVANVGTDNATNVSISDQIPAGTTYVAGSTTLNGVSVADPQPGVSALASGMLVNAPSTATAGSMPADASAGAGNVATIEFEVVTDSNLADGSVVSNQAFLTAAAAGIVDQPSDDPRTPAADDPTIDFIGNPLVNAYFEKTVVNVSANASPAPTAEPGDTLRYTLRVQTTDTPVDDIRIYDDLGALNATPVFVPGSLTILSGSLPAGADVSNTDSTGGTNGAGFVDIRNLSLPANSQFAIEFDVVLASVIPNGTLVVNQSQLTAAGGFVGISDDPGVNGQADPSVLGDEDPTTVQIVAAPVFDIEKVSTYLDGDPARLLAGERVRYTITVANVGTDDATNVLLRDQIPANTAYVAGSTTLNGTAVADPQPGIAPLVQGMSINAPSTSTAGLMPADPLAAAGNTATIVFDVVVDPDLVDGTIISNQAFLNALDSGIVDQPSDDPRTPVLNDPTRDIVGNFPLLYAEKSAALAVDNGTAGVVDPGDTLRYTIAVYNNGPIPATQAVITDAVPSNTTYVADSTTLNGIALGSDGGVSPLIGGLDVSSSDLTPPLPGSLDGTLSPGESAVIQFDVLIDAGVPPGTLIVNQATATTYELPAVLTDGDGNPATGPEPTVVVVGPSQQLSISKQVAVVGGGPALAGATLEYTIRVLNIGLVPASYVRIYDDLDQPVAGQLVYVPGSGTLDQSATGVSFGGSTLAADFGANYGTLAPGAQTTLRFQATIDANVPMGAVITNTAEVTWNDPPQNATATVSVTEGGTPGVGTLNGSVWHDADFDDLQDTTERALEDWAIDLYQDGDLVHSTVTDADGNYRISGLAPTYLAAERYELRFSAPGAGPSTASLGTAFSDFTNGPQRIGDIQVDSGSNLQNLDLPIDPNGVVYNSVGRIPIAGAILSMTDAGTGAVLPASCFDDPVQQGQVTLADGYYKFDINFSDIACPEGGDYAISVTPPSVQFIDRPSEFIPPASDITTAPLSVPACLQGGAADAIPATTLFCEATGSELLPPASVPSQSSGTVYYLHLTLDNSSNPGSRQIFNNHIPLDPDLADSVSITKTSPALSVRRGDLVPYVITVTNDVGFDLSEVSVVDRFPPGFKYVEGSAQMDDMPAEPVILGGELVWSDLAITGAGRHTIELLLAVGAGVSEGEFVNRAQVVHGVTGNALSNEASATVRLVPDPDFDCTDVMGKVFDDVNRNGTQDAGEAGIGGVRLVTANGLAATTDSYGRYHITCATVPNEARGSNFVMKLDDRTLPTGFRSSGQTVQIQRATRGKALRFNFGASIHRVIGLDISDPIFEPGLTELRPQWRSRIDLLLEELQAAPATLRLSYLADVEDPGLVEDRLDAMERRILDLWDEKGCCYELDIEPEVFWRRGTPTEAPRRRRRDRQ